MSHKSFKYIIFGLIAMRVASVELCSDMFPTHPDCEGCCQRAGLVLSSNAQYNCECVGPYDPSCTAFRKDSSDCRDCCSGYGDLVIPDDRAKRCRCIEGKPKEESKSEQ